MKSDNKIWYKASETSQEYQFMGQIYRIFSKMWFRISLTTGITKFFIHFKDKMGAIYFLESEIEGNSKYLTDKVLANPSWGIKLLERIEKYHLKFFKYTESLRSIDFTKLSDRQLVKLLGNAQILNLVGHEITSSISWQLDKDSMRFNNRINEMVENQIKKRNKNFKTKIILPELTTSLKDTFIIKEQLDLLDIAKKIVKNKEIKNIFIQHDNEKKIIEKLAKKDEKIYNQIFKHHKNFRWLAYIYKEPAYKLKYYIDRIKYLARDEASILRLISRYKDGKKKTIDVRKILVKELDFNNKQLLTLEFAGELSYIKEFRRAVISHGTFCLRNIFIEISKRFNVTMEQIRMMDYLEIKNAVRNNQFDSKELNKRTEEVIYYYERGKKKKIMTGSEIKEFLKGINIYKKVDSKPKIIEGTIASSGKVRGTVRIVNNRADANKLKKGEILVTRDTDSNLSLAIDKAIGIISECGGLTCHAAIASREKNVPCLVGVEDASNLLNDGDEIELDAEKGVIKKL